MKRTRPLHALLSPVCVPGRAVVGVRARRPSRGTEKERECESEHEVLIWICELQLFILPIQGLKDEGKSYKR